MKVPVNVVNRRPRVSFNGNRERKPRSAGCPEGATNDLVVNTSPEGLQRWIVVTPYLLDGTIIPCGAKNF